METIAQIERLLFAYNLKLEASNLKDVLGKLQGQDIQTSSESLAIIPGIELKDIDNFLESSAKKPKVLLEVDMSWCTCILAKTPQKTFMYHAPIRQLRTPTDIEFFQLDVLAESIAQQENALICSLGGFALPPESRAQIQEVLYAYFSRVGQYIDLGKTIHDKPIIGAGYQPVAAGVDRLYALHA